MARTAYFWSALIVLFLTAGLVIQLQVMGASQSFAMLSPAVAGFLVIKACAMLRPRESVWGRFTLAQFSTFMLGLVALQTAFQVVRASLGSDDGGDFAVRELIKASALGVLIAAPLFEEAVRARAGQHHADTRLRPRPDLWHPHVWMAWHAHCGRFYRNTNLDPGQLRLAWRHTPCIFPGCTAGREKSLVGATCCCSSCTAGRPPACGPGSRSVDSAARLALCTLPRTSMACRTMGLWVLSGAPAAAGCSRPLSAAHPAHSAVTDRLRSSFGSQDEPTVTSILAYPLASSWWVLD